MTQKKSYKIGEVVSCRCPESVYKLPEGLHAGASVEVISSYLDRSYVRYYDKTFIVRNACLHKES